MTSPYLCRFVGSDDDQSAVPCVAQRARRPDLSDQGSWAVAQVRESWGAGRIWARSRRRKYVRLQWATEFASVPVVVLDRGADSEGAWMLTAGLPGDSAVSDRWKDGSRDGRPGGWSRAAPAARRAAG